MEQLNDRLPSGRSWKPTILVLLQSYLPGYKAGGPVRSIANMVEALGDEFEFRIITADRDMGEPIPYPGIELYTWTPVGKAQVMYIPTGFRSVLRTISVLKSTPADILYLNSFFARKYSMIAFLARGLGLLHVQRIILAPRGEFSIGALRFKAWRKWTYIALARALGLYRPLVWHASSQYEEQDIRSVFCDAEDISVANPFADAKPSRKKYITVVTALDMPESGKLQISSRIREKPAGRIRLVFVSRICRKKNLDRAISLLQGLSGDVHFTIYGPAEDTGYWDTCRKMIAELPPNIHVEYGGEILHDRIDSVLLQNDVFLFPTHGENYGHVILEALVAGCPVVISDQTPWRDLEKLGVGWDFSLGDTLGFQRALQNCIDMEPAAFAEISRRARLFGLAKTMDPLILDQNRALFCNHLPEHFHRETVDA